MLNEMRRWGGGGGGGNGVAGYLTKAVIGNWYGPLNSEPIFEKDGIPHFEIPFRQARDSPAVTICSNQKL